MTEHTKIDLHIHTTVSDGTVPPEVLPSLIEETEIGIFSVTDHDAINCSRIIPPLLREGGPVFIPGVEFSCKDEYGKYHILGYAYDPATPGIREAVAYGHRLRTEKFSIRIHGLKQKFGFEFPEEELAKLFALDNPGKPHLANLMTKLGYAESKEQAICEWIDNVSAPGTDHLRPEEAIQGILASGGIPVLAHPCFGSGNELILDEDLVLRVHRLIAFGLKGLEAFYSGFNREHRRQVLDIAERCGLYVTAGSDYHGTNKAVPLGGSGLSPEEPYPEGLVRFLHDTVHR